MNKPLLYSMIVATAVGAVALTPIAVGAVANRNGNAQAPSQAVRARDGSGPGAQTGVHPANQERQYIHQADGTCDGTGVGDGTGSQQRQHGRQ